MKVTDKAQQKNVILNKDYCSSSEIKILLDNNEIFFIDKDGKICSDHDEYVKVFCDYQLLIGLKKGDELKVILNDYGYYITVLIRYGRKYCIILN